MKPLEKGVPSEAGRQFSDGGPCQYEQSAKEKQDGRKVKCRKIFLDEEREYHVILWGATGFAGRFAAEYLAHYYMKHEDPSLYPFKSSAFPPVCPGAGGNSEASAAKPIAKSAPASGFLPSGLTPGEHKPGVTPPIRGTSFGATRKSDFEDLIPGPELFSRADRVLGAEATIRASECKPRSELSFNSAVSGLESEQIFAQGEGSPPVTTAVADAVTRCACLREARSRDHTCDSQCIDKNDFANLFDDKKESKNLAQNTCSIETLHRSDNNGRHNRMYLPKLVSTGDAAEVRRTARGRGDEGKRENGWSGGIRNKKATAERREQQDGDSSASPVPRKHGGKSRTGQKDAEERHGRGEGNSKGKSQREDTRFIKSGCREERESEAEEGAEERRKGAEQGEKKGNGGIKEIGSRLADYRRKEDATSQRKEEAGEESGNEEEEERGNSAAEENDDSPARPRRKGAQSHALRQRTEMEKNGKRTRSQRLKACSCLSCDLALMKPPSSSSESASCLEATALHATSARERIKFALAGRSMTKLRHLRYQLAERLGRHCMRIDLIAVNPGDEEALEKLCSRGRVVLSTCGPYRLCGEPIVKACISARTHYCDITAEVSYVADMAAKYSAAAAERNLKLLFFCGAGSLPSDLTVLMTQREALRMRGIPCHEIRTAVTDCFGGFSGGSVMGLGHIFEEGAVFDPFFLVKYASPSPPSEEELLPYIRPQLFLAKHDEDFGYCAYNVLAPLNENVVRLSSVLLGLYARQEPRRNARSAQKAMKTRRKEDGVNEPAAQQEKTEHATFESSPWRGTSTSSPLFSVSPAGSPGSRDLSSSKASFSSSSKCTPSRSHISSSASNSPSFRHSPSFSPASCRRRRSRSLPSSPASPLSGKSVFFSPSVLPSAPWRASAASPVQRRSTQPDSATAVSATATSAAAATRAPPPFPPPAPAATARRTSCSPAVSALDTFSPFWTDSSFFHYSECVALGYDVLTASVVSLITFILMFLVTSSFCRAALTALHIFPRPGEGPPRQFLDKGHFQIKTVGRVYPSDEKKTPVFCVPVDDDEEEAEKEQERRFYKPPHCHDRETVITVTMGSASGDPGYKETGKMLVETGLAIALHIEDCFELCGVCTPASGVGLVLVDRLRKAGMKFEVKVKQF